MAFRKETKVRSVFTKIALGLASPEEILDKLEEEIKELKKEIAALKNRV